MELIRVFLADDHRIFLEGLLRLIKDQPSMAVTGTAVNGREAVKQIEALHPDIAIMDISMPNLNGIEATRLIKKLSPTTKVVILTCMIMNSS